MGNVFLSYSHKDAHHLADLRRHAQRLVDASQIELWHDEAILPGEPWANAIRRHLDDSRLVIALLSPDFLQSEWCIGELGRAFELRDRRLIDVVPIVVRQCAWRETQLGAIQALPAGGAPLESFPDPQAAWVEVVSKLEQLLKGQRVQPAFPARSELVRRYAELLEANRRLMILAPWCEGLEDLAQEVARRSHGDRVTLLRPPALAEMTAHEFYAELSGEPSVTCNSEFRAWLKKRCATNGANGSNHLVVLPYFGGPAKHVLDLGKALRGVFDETGRFSMLAVGSEHCARLLGEVQDMSLYTGIATEHVPGLDLEQTREILRRFGAEPVYAAAVQQATGGHPEWTALAAVETRHGRLQGLPQYLAAKKIYPVLFGRLMYKETGRTGSAHASATLKNMLEGKSVVQLSDANNDLGFAVVRLYFDGILVERNGTTEFRCEAARIAAKRVLEIWEAGES